MADVRQDVIIDEKGKLRTVRELPAGAYFFSILVVNKLTGEQATQEVKLLVSGDGEQQVVPADLDFEIKGSKKIKEGEEFVLQVELNKDVPGVRFAVEPLPGTENFLQITGDGRITSDVELRLTGIHRFRVSVVLPNGESISKELKLQVQVKPEIEIISKEEEEKLRQEQLEKYKQLLSDKDKAALEKLEKQEQFRKAQQALLKQAVKGDAKAAWQMIQNGRNVLHEDPAMQRRALGIYEAALNPAKLFSLEAIPTGPSYYKMFKDELKVKLKAGLISFKDYNKETVKILGSLGFDYLKKKEPFKNPLTTIEIYHHKVKKGKEKEGSVPGYLLIELGKRAILGTIETVRKVVDTGRKGLGGLRRVPMINKAVTGIKNTRTSQWVTTQASAVKGTRLGQLISKVYNVENLDDVRSGMKRTADGVRRIYSGTKGIATAWGNGAGIVLKSGVNVLKTGGIVLKSAPYGLLTALGAAVAFGPTTPVIIASAAAGIGVKSVSNFLAVRPYDAIRYIPSKTPRLLRPFAYVGSSVSNRLRKIQIAYGWGDTKNLDGSINHDFKNTTQGRFARSTRTNIYSRPARAIRAVNSGMTLGSVFAIGGGLLGLNPAVAFATGAALGVGTRAILDSRAGSFLDDVLLRNGKMPAAFRHLASIPTFALMDVGLSNFWMGEQMKLLRTKYNGNLLEFLQGEYGGISKFGEDNRAFFMSGMNWLGALGYISSQYSLAKSVIGLQIFRQLEGAGLTKLMMSIRGSTMLFGSVIGAIGGFLAASALGIGFGPAALIGAALGGAVGTLVGGVLAGALTASTGIGALASGAIIAVTTGIGQIIGQVIGSQFDKIVNRVTDGALSIINNLSALMNLLHLLKTGLNFDRLIPLTFALIGIMAAVDKGGLLNTSNDCLPGEATGGASGCQGQSPEADSSFWDFLSGQQQPGYDTLALDTYGVKLIGAGSYSWTQADITKILAALSETDETTINSLRAKNVFISLGESTAVYTGEEFVLIGITKADLNNTNLLQQKLNEHLHTLAQL